MDTSIKSQNKQIYSAYDHHQPCNLFIPLGDDKTKQSFGAECDINCIMARYEKTGIIQSGNSLPGHYGEAHAFDFQEAQNLMISANNHFNALPATIRATFNNDPHTMLVWMDDPQNHAESVKMGLRAADKIGVEVHPTPSLEVAKKPLPVIPPALDLAGKPIPGP